MTSQYLLVQLNYQALVIDHFILLFCKGHLLNNKKCAAHYDDNQFSILAKGRTLFHLSTLEATFIKMLKPELCRQKEFVYTLKLRH